MNNFKPYQLVYVDLIPTRGYAFVGEVMSFPIPNANDAMTIMVRRVPDHPGTLVELPLSVLSSLSSVLTHPRYVHYATVDGRGAFPVDMLRYDCAAPVNFKIEDTGRGERAIIDLSHGFKELVIATTTSNRLPHWSHGRWDSLMWTAKPLKTLKLERRGIAA